MASITTEIKRPIANCFRRAYVKRRDATTGKFEANWQEITEDIRRWGQIRREIDPLRPGRFRLSSLMLTVANDEGRFNPETDDNSLWFQYANQQRSLVKIEAGYRNSSLSAAGIWTHTEYPTVPTAFLGVLSGDQVQTGSNTISLQVRPLTALFDQFPARLITGYTSTGLTASQFIEAIRDQTDGAGEYVFRPFFGDTTSNWSISTTTNVYPGLNTGTAEDVIDKTCWDLIQDLALAENYIFYLDRTGVINFSTRSPATSTATFEFYGVNTFNTEYGHTITKIQSFGPRVENYYSRVQLQFATAETDTSYAVTESTLTVSGTNNVWNFGHRTLELSSRWISTTAPAAAVTSSVHTEYSQLKNEIQFSTSLVPHLEIQDKIKISYDSTEAQASSLWDFNNWADDPAGDDLYWDDSKGDAIRMDNEEYRILRIDLNLDRLETQFYCRKV